ncbi:MAG: hypothetical protein CMM94_06410, partial [Rickettsiales bacterium]|nr:hypothetical protein [Rickettsiales bacterium]
MKSKAPAEIKHVCAVVVTYNIGEAFIPNFEAVRQQVGHVVVVDNGSTDDTLSVLKDLSDTYPGTLEIIHNDENNLAKAQNVGIDHARNLGFGWVLLLDHDSLATKDMVATMLNAYNHSLNRQRIGIVAPYLDDANTCKKPRY